MSVYCFTETYWEPNANLAVEIEGIDATIGFTQWIGRIPTKNADVGAPSYNLFLRLLIFRYTQFVQTLLDEGAVLYVKTNVPQTMLAFECNNPLFGRTVNPWNPKHYTCGGSSGGEAALIALDGSPLGLGSDIGGSLRIPTAYCGIYSLKPGSWRTSMYGARAPVPGFDAIRTQGGPMGRSVEDLELFARAVFGKESTMRDVAPVLYRDVQLPKKLRVGYYTSGESLRKAVG